MANIILTNQINTINTSLTTLSKVFYNASVLIYQGIPNKTVTDVVFDNAVIDFTYIPSYFKFLNILSYSQVGIIIEYYVKQVNIFIALVRSYNLYSQLQGKIIELEKSISTIDNFSKALLGIETQSIFQYNVPTNMSLRKAMFLNNLDFNTQIEEVLFLNIGRIVTVNYIPKGTNILLMRV